jgi:hypothetical protein
MNSAFKTVLDVTTYIFKSCRIAKGGIGRERERKRDLNGNRLLRCVRQYTMPYFLYF